MVDRFYCGNDLKKNHSRHWLRGQFKTTYHHFSFSHYANDIIRTDISDACRALPRAGTWLQWPHQYEYGITYRNNLHANWVAMASNGNRRKAFHLPGMT
jgi:hypothetical protein